MFNVQATKWFPDFASSLSSMTGKTVAITGTTSGTGFVCAATVLRKGGKVIVLNRPSERAEKAIASLKQDYGKAEHVTQINCDLQSFASVRAAAAEVNKLVADSGLDVLCNNAGIMALPDNVTADGYEQQMQTNHLSHFLLTSLLMPALERAAGQSRVVNHSSGARKLPATPLAAKNLKKGTAGSFGGNSSTARYERYHQTKLANVVFTEVLQDRLDASKADVIVTVAHPGATASSLQTNTSASGAGWLHDTFLTYMMRFVAQSAEDGTMPLLQCVCSEGVKARAFYGAGNKGVVGQVMGDGVTGPPQLVATEPLCTNTDSKKMLWELSEQACGSFF